MPSKSDKELILMPGGANGAVPSDLLPSPLDELGPGARLPAGLTITVQATNVTGTGYVPLYTQVTGGGSTGSTLVTPDSTARGGYFITGNYVFSQMPVYFSYSPTNVGTVYFDQLPESA